MKYVSTRGAAPAVSFREAVLAGIAPDGGLYVPDTIPQLPDRTWTELRGQGVAAVAATMLSPYVGPDLPPDTLASLLADALDFPMPVADLDHRLSVLELFHGPTFAFKDVGARVLARLLSAFHAPGEPPLTVLVATSGDTGGAVAHAFHGVPRTAVVVLYPRGQVSLVQEAQFATLGGNVTAVAVEGAFDDCQRLAKQAFADADLAARLRLTSANSISLGRLLPQMVYYATAALASPIPPAMSVPSGNFGNVAAGLLARKMGAPIAGFHAATTVNDTVPRYLASGQVAPRPSVPTLANAMDVGDPSNLERIRWIAGDRVDEVRRLMSASVHTDDEVKAGMAELDSRYGYTADPHTTIAYLGSRLLRSDRVVFLATAHPAKFGDRVEEVLRRPVPLPPALAEALSRPSQAIRIEPTLDALKGELLN